MTTEYVTLEYQNDAKLYVPVASLNLISRYSGGAEESAPLHKLVVTLGVKHVAKRQRKFVMSRLSFWMFMPNVS
ncbi:transcription-repair coupling factor [Vibrio astriarenae]|nr:transcription-repair coupling factor [Vibrio sp. C7]